MRRFFSFISCFILLFEIRSAAQQKHIDSQAFQDLISACKKTHSAGLSVWINGQPYKSYSFEKSETLIPAYSAAKSLVSLTIGKLITDGKIKSIDTPVYCFYPEWKQGLKKKVTLRHLLNHTSGIEYHESDPDGWAPDDIVKYATSASLTDTPGTSFLYNDNAVRLLHGVIEKITGMPMDQYIAKEIFKPMGIEKYSWQRDKAGNPDGLNISPEELVKIGQLILNDGRWNDKSLISPEWLAISLIQGQPFVPNCGLLWWRIPEKIIYTVDDTLLEAF